jgi:hypothetical protein
MIVGVNYPWRRYGGDFGPTVWGSRSGIASAADAVAAEFAAMAGAGVEVVRWFLFADARGGIRLDAGGWPDGFGEGTLEDLDTWLAIALAHAVRVVPVLFDHTLAFRAATIGGAAVGGHGRWLAEPTGHARLLDTVVGPLARRYGSRGSHAELGAAVFAWDLLNEPDWLVAEHAPSARVEQPMPFDVLAAWVRDACGVFHGADAGAVTVGSARLRFASWWDDQRLGLDFLQAHAYYDPAHDLDLLATPYAVLRLSRPLVIGECSGQGDAEDPARGRPRLDVARLVAEAAARGYDGAWPWSWRGVDAHGPVSPGTMGEVKRAVDELRGRSA